MTPTTVWIEIAGRIRKVDLPAGAATATHGPMACSVDGSPILIDARLIAPGLLSLILEEGRQLQCLLDISPEGEAVLVNGHRFDFAISDPRSLRAGRGAGAHADGPKSIKAPMPGRVVKVLVAVGDEVAAQQGLVVIEAMKMQNELKSPKSGRVIRLGPGEGETVQPGEVLAVVE